MAEHTKIQWATHSWSPWIGCAKVHTGCTNCYAEADFAIRRKRVIWGPNGTRVKTSESYWRQPLKWNREAAESGDRPRIFPSLCDPFENQLELEPWRREMFALIEATPNLIWILLTKRPENIRRMWPKWTLRGHSHPTEPRACRNCWLIYSASDQASLEAGIGHLLQCRHLVPVLGLSLEPLLGMIDLECIHDLDWVIVGGESGPHARPCDVAWIRSIVMQCADANVPCFVKQLGANAHGLLDAPRSVEQRVVLCHPKGGDPDEWPVDLRVREFPVKRGE